MLFAFIAAAIVLVHASCQPECTFQPFFLEHVCIIICYFSYRLNCLLILIHYLRIIWDISYLHLYTFQDYHSSGHTRFPFFIELMILILLMMSFPTMVASS